MRIRSHRSRSGLRCFVPNGTGSRWSRPFLFFVGLGRTGAPTGLGFPRESDRTAAAVGYVVSPLKGLACGGGCLPPSAGLTHWYEDGFFCSRFFLPSVKPLREGLVTTGLMVRRRSPQEPGPAQFGRGPRPRQTGAYRVKVEPRLYLGGLPFGTQGKQVEPAPLLRAGKTEPRNLKSEICELRESPDLAL